MKKTFNDLIEHLKTLPGDIQPGIEGENFELEFDVADYGVTLDADGKSLEDLYREISAETRTSSREPVFYASRQGRIAFNNAMKAHIENENN